MPKPRQPQTEQDWLDQAESPEYEGQLAIDVYQTDESVIIQAPIAGVQPDHLEISITDDVISIRGERYQEQSIPEENYFAQECYWGTFSRSYLMPMLIEADSAKASLKNGILTVTIPKQAKAKTRIVKVTAAEWQNG